MATVHYCFVNPYCSCVLSDDLYIQYSNIITSSTITPFTSSISIISTCNAPATKDGTGISGSQNEFVYSHIYLLCRHMPSQLRHNANASSFVRCDCFQRIRLRLGYIANVDVLCMYSNGYKSWSSCSDVNKHSASSYCLRSCQAEGQSYVVHVVLRPVVFRAMGKSGRANLQGLVLGFGRDTMYTKAIRLCSCFVFAHYTIIVLACTVYVCARDDPFLGRAKHRLT